MQWNATSRDMSSPGFDALKTIDDCTDNVLLERTVYVPHKTAGAFDGFFCFFSRVRFYVLFHR